MLLLACLLFLAGSTVAQPIQFSRAVAVGNHVGYLGWNSLPAASEYQLYRHFPGSSFTRIATLHDTVYFDTLTRTVCADTVTYYVAAQLPDTLLRSPEAGIFYQDNLPTAPCSLRTFTVDTALRRVRLTWYPSPDTDILGYYICLGYPCMGYDTAWGRLNTSYLCSSDIDPRQQQRFRVLAFDSCFQASPLTPYCSFPVVECSSFPCDYQHLRFRWQPYYNMPDSVGAYRLFYRFEGDTELHCHTVAGTSPAADLVFDTMVDNYAVLSVYCYLRVDSRNDSLQAFSLPVTFRMQRADSVGYVGIRSLRYDEAVPMAELSIVIDTDFVGDGTFLVERRRLAEPAFEVVDILSRSDQAATYIYNDYNIEYTAGGYVYRVGVPDDCGQRLKYSDTVQLLLPPVEEAMAFFPNVLVAGREGLDRFCPHLISPLAKDYSLDIYNRFGVLCFHSSLLGECWDGVDGSGRPLPQGTYVYCLHCLHADGTDKTYHGSVVILR